MSPKVRKDWPKYEPSLQLDEGFVAPEVKVVFGTSPLSFHRLLHDGGLPLFSHHVAVVACWCAGLVSVRRLLSGRVCVCSC